MPAPDTWRPRVLGETATAGMAYGILGLVLSPFCMFGVIVSLVGMAVAFKDYIKIRTGRLPRSEMPKVIIAWTCGLFALLWTAVALLIFLATTFEPGRAAF